MKVLVFIISMLILAKFPVYSQNITDSLTNEQKAELINQFFLQIIAPSGGINTGKANKDKEQQDSIRRVVEAKYKPGTTAPDFCFKDITEKEVTLRNLRGKYVYMDIWATWCGPCQKELPYLKQLEEKMKDKNIVFVSVSWDRNRQNWVKMVKEEKLGGLQLHFNNDETFFKEFGVEFIPRFLLLDKKGKVISIDMSRPSDPQTEQALSALKGI